MAHRGACNGPQAGACTSSSACASRGAALERSVDVRGDERDREGDELARCAVEPRRIDGGLGSSSSAPGRAMTPRDHTNQGDEANTHRPVCVQPARRTTTGDDHV